MPGPVDRDEGETSAGGTVGDDPDDEVAELLDEEVDDVEEGVEYELETIGKYGLTVASSVITLDDEASRSVNGVTPFSTFLDPSDETTWTPSPD